MRPKSIIKNIKRGNVAKVVGSLTPGCHQTENWTGLDRYPEIFTATAAVAPDARSVLSFGCSTGEECVTLARYFPKAQIVGADINLLNLLLAMKHRSDRIRFVFASDRTLSGLGGFEVLFCMSVLRNPKSKRRAGLYPFERFEERALFLESLVLPGGILVIHNAMYRFGDTAHKSSYQKIPVVARHDKDVFLRDGVTQAEPDHCLFRKL